MAGLGLAMSISFSRPDTSALPILLMGVLIVVFLFFEARRYRYFNFFRDRARWMETNFYAPMLLGQGCICGTGWEKVLSQDYCAPIPLTLSRADAGCGELTYSAAAIGPIPGEAILAAGVVFNGVWIIFAFVTYYSDPDVVDADLADYFNAGSL